MLDKGSSQPSPGDLVLHSCHGKARLWANAGIDNECTGCHAPVAGDVEYRPGHAHFYCRCCGRLVGLCAGGLLEEIEAAARKVIEDADRLRRRREGGKR